MPLPVNPRRGFFYANGLLRLEMYGTRGLYLNDFTIGHADDLLVAQNKSV